MPPLHRAAAVALLLLAAAARADDEPAVTPYRPSVSTPAALSAPGWLEIEAGLQADRDKGAGTRRRSLPYTLKLAFTPDSGVRLGGEAAVRETAADGGHVSGAGDTSVVLKRRFAVDDAHAFGLELGATLPTGHRGIGAEHAAYAVNGIYSADLGTLHTDLNLATTRVGQAEPGASRYQASWAAALSGPFDERWGWVGELSGTHQRGADHSSQLLVAASFGVSKAVSLDAGLARSLRSGAPAWSVFTGVTLLAARLF